MTRPINDNIMQRPESLLSSRSRLHSHRFGDVPQACGIFSQRENQLVPEIAINAITTLTIMICDQRPTLGEVNNHSSFGCFLRLLCRQDEPYVLRARFGQIASRRGRGG
jgi:hypothetical protein